jgi:hypothetical protein
MEKPWLSLSKAGGDTKIQLRFFSVLLLFFAGTRARVA